MSDDWYKQGARAVDNDMKVEVLARLLSVWQENPSLRFMQLVCNVFPHSDPYYVEDYDMVKIIEGYYKRPDS